MSIKDIIANGGGVLILIMTVIQIAPIRMNPWTRIATWIGRAVNGEVLARVAELDTDLKGLHEEVAQTVAVDCRARILRFGDEVLHGERHSKDHFEQVLRDIKSYELYCEEHPNFENNVTEMIGDRIKDVYRKCLQKNDFL